MSIANLFCYESRTHSDCIPHSQTNSFAFSALDFLVCYEMRTAPANHSAPHAPTQMEATRDDELSCDELQCVDLRLSRAESPFNTISQMGGLWDHLFPSSPLRFDPPQRSPYTCPAPLEPGRAELNSAFPFEFPYLYLFQLT
jgi:hypothetical protein